MPIQPADGTGLIAAQLCAGEDDWVEGDYACGDVLTFPSHTVHRGLRCQLKDRARLSLDVRYQPADEVIEEKSLRPHCDLTWEEIYRGWERSDLQYYWTKTALELSPWDERFLQPSRRIC